MPNDIEDAKPVVDDTTVQALEATAAEHDVTVLQALRLYPKALGWAAYFALGIIMVAFDPQLIGQLIATPAFQKDFGHLDGDSYIVSAPWQMALNMGAPIGQILGTFTVGYLMETLGMKKSFGLCNILIVGTIFLQFFARSIKVLLAGEILAGLVLGGFVVIVPAYASEVAPLALRGVVTASINLCFACGQLIANGTVAGTQKLSSHWAYDIAFAVQWAWPLIIVVGFPFAPESPWWLQRQGRMEDAKQALAFLSSSHVDIDAALAVIVETDRTERELEMGSTYADCFHGSNRRRTIIAISVMVIQVFSGIYLASYSTYFFQLAGLPTDQAFNMGVGFIALGLFGTCLSWFVISHVGRRTLYNVGLSILTCLQLLVAGLDCAPSYSTNSSFAWAESVIMMIWYWVYSLSIGPVSYVILCEVSAVRVRAKTIAIALASNALATIVMTVIFPYMVNPDEGKMRGKIGFFFGGLASLCLIWTWFFLPELKGLTFQEIDLQFDRGVAAREFGTILTPAVCEKVISMAEDNKEAHDAKGTKIAIEMVTTNA